MRITSSVLVVACALALTAQDKKDEKGGPLTKAARATEKAAGAVAGKTKEVAKATADKTKIAAKATADATKTAAKVTAEKTRDAASATVSGTKRATAATGGAIERVGEKLTKSTGLVDINSATPEELQKLPGIGPAYAQKIIRNRPYARKDELTSKNVIPQATYDQVKGSIIAKQK